MDGEPPEKQKLLSRYFGDGGSECAPKDSNPEQGSTSQLDQGLMFLYL